MRCVQLVLLVQHASLVTRTFLILNKQQPTLMDLRLFYASARALLASTILAKPIPALIVTALAPPAPSETHATPATPTEPTPQPPPPTTMEQLPLFVLLRVKLDSTKMKQVIVIPALSPVQLAHSNLLVIPVSLDTTLIRRLILILMEQMASLAHRKSSPALQANTVMSLVTVWPVTQVAQPVQVELLVAPANLTPTVLAPPMQPTVFAHALLAITKMGLGSAYHAPDPSTVKHASKMTQGNYAHLASAIIIECSAIKDHASATPVTSRTQTIQVERIARSQPQSLDDNPNQRSLSL